MNNFQFDNMEFKMSGLVISICWGVFVYGLVMLSKMTPHTDEYNSLLILVIFTGILGPGLTCLLIINAYLRHREEQSKKQRPLLPEAVYVIV